MNVSSFLKKNKVERGTTEYAASKSFLDENGEPLKWVIRPITTKLNDDLQDSCMYEVPVTGKPNQYRQKLNSTKYLAKLIAASVVEPNLLDASLQDSYGVHTPEDLIREMIDILNSEKMNGQGPGNVVIGPGT